MFFRQSLKILSSYFIVSADSPQSSCESTDILIKGGKVINADSSQKADVLISNGIIKEIGKNISTNGNAKVIPADNMYVIPGGIDPHTHFEMEIMGTKSADDFYCGTKAAIAGGTTTIIDFAIAKPNQSLIEVFEEYRKKAHGNVCCDFALHIGVTWWSEQVCNEMKNLCEKCGVNSFKVFMAYKNLLMLCDSELYSVFSRCKNIGAVAMVHAENGSVVAKNITKLKCEGVLEPYGHQLAHTADEEAEAVNRAAVIAKQVDCPLYVVHVMSEEAANVIKHRRKGGQTNLYGEVIAAAIGKSFPQTCKFDEVAGHIMSPALRDEPRHADALLTALKNDILQTTGSDNCTYSKEQKRCGKNDFSKIPNGVNGVEDRMAVIWTKGVNSCKIDAQKFVQITSTTAAKIFNLYPKKGVIAVDSDADIVIWDPKKERTISAKDHHHAHDFNIFEGMTVTGGPHIVMVRGKVMFECDKLKKDIKGHGKYLERKPFPEYVYCQDKKKK